MDSVSAVLGLRKDTDLLYEEVLEESLLNRRVRCLSSSVLLCTLLGWRKVLNFDGEVGDVVLVIERAVKEPVLVPLHSTKTMAFLLCFIVLIYVPVVSHLVILMLLDLLQCKAVRVCVVGLRLLSCSFPYF